MTSLFNSNMLSKIKKDAKKNPNTPVIWNISHSLVIRAIYHSEQDKFSFEKLCFILTDENDLFV